MAQQTAVEYLFHQLWDTPKDKWNWYAILKEAKQMEKEQTGYSKEDVLKAGEIGEINHHDYEHIVSLLDEAREINRQNKQLV